MDEQRVVVRGLRKVYPSVQGDVVAVDGVDLSVSGGTFVSIVGPSGCGKSTMLMIVAGLVSPSAEPGETVFRTLLDFKRQLRGSGAQLIPWIQDWNYSPDAVMQQVRAARLQGAKGFLLWNANGLYTKQALAPPPS